MLVGNINRKATSEYTWVIGINKHNLNFEWE